MRINKLAALSVVALAVNCSLVEGSRPNIVVILTDDQGYQDLGCFGSPDIRTPNLDRMAEEGMKLTDFYVASAVCSPSRAALLTGYYPENLGVTHVFFPNNKNHGLAPSFITIAEVLKSVGYSTMAVGKWHLGDEKQFLPTNQGFDDYYGIPYSNDMYPAKNMTYAEDCVWREGFSKQSLTEVFKNLSKRVNPRKIKGKVPLMRGEECVEFPTDQSTITRRFTDEAIRFVQKSHKEQQPFFLYLAHSMPHIPLNVSADFKGKSKRGLYGDVIEEIDFNVGRVLAQLKNLGLDKNTIVLFTSDNGPWLIKGDQGGSALPLFEGKGTAFEGGQRVPAIVKWPDQVPAGSVCGELMTAMDLLPTFAAITGAVIPEDEHLDGQNVIKLLTAEKGAKSKYDYFYFGTKAVRSGDWKYHAKESFMVEETRREFTGPTLYNLKKDLGESRNLITQHPDIAERLSKALKKQVMKYRSAQRK